MEGFANTMAYRSSTIARVKGKGQQRGKNISLRDKVLTSSSGWSETPVKHIRENGSLKSEAAPNQEAAHDRNRGRDMGLDRNSGSRLREPEL